jgi:fibronectin type 3 domain-containing protein
LSSGATYYYKVAAHNDAGVGGDQSASASALTIPGAPSVSASAASSSSITVSWSEVTGATRYYIYRSSSADGSYTQLTNTTSLSYTNTGLSSGATYYYKVAAYNSAGTGQQSVAASATTLLAPPSSVSASAASTASITVSWGSVTGAVEYYIYRSSSSSGTYTRVTTTPSAITGASYTDTGLSSGATYYYKVAAHNGSGVGAMSSSYGSATTLVALLSPPTTVTASAASSSGITVSWSSVTGATRYYIYRSSSADGSYTQLTYTTSLSYTNTGLSSGATYYYKVAAYNSAGIGAMSSVYGSATTTSSVPSLGSSLSFNTWRNGTVSSSSSQYYYFYATSGSSYSIKWNDSYQGDGTKTGDVKVSAYWYSDNASIFSQIDSGYNSPQTFTATKTGYVMLRVEPYSSSYSGSFAIAYY